MYILCIRSLIHVRVTACKITRHHITRRADSERRGERTPVKEARRFHSEEPFSRVIISKLSHGRHTTDAWSPGTVVCRPCDTIFALLHCVQSSPAPEVADGSNADEGRAAGVLWVVQVGRHEWHTEAARVRVSALPCAAHVDRPLPSFACVADPTLRRDKEGVHHPARRGELTSAWRLPYG